MKMRKKKDVHRMMLHFLKNTLRIQNGLNTKTQISLSLLPFFRFVSVFGRVEHNCGWLCICLFF